MSMDVSALEILYQDAYCLVVNKGPGILTHAPPGIDSLEVRVKAWLRQRAGDPEKIYVGVLHRLDRPASGALLFALTRRAAQRLAAQFENRAVKKLYWACVEGRVEPTEGTWKDFLCKVPGEPRAEMVSPDHPDSRHAVLHYRVLAQREWGSWLEIRLDTGRYHQIRVQAASRGHPVLGDVQYGAGFRFGQPTSENQKAFLGSGSAAKPGGPFGPLEPDPRLQPIALHARTLVFRHPKTKETVLVRAPLPECWKELHLPEILAPSTSDPPCDPWEGLF